MVKKFVLVMLSVLPIASISTVANAKLEDIRGKEDADRIDNEINEIRGLLFPQWTMAVTHEAAIARLKDLKGIQDERILREEYERMLGILKKSQDYEINEKMIVSGVPSHIH